MMNRNKKTLGQAVIDLTPLLDVVLLVLIVVLCSQSSQAGDASAAGQELITIQDTNNQLTNEIETLKEQLANFENESEYMNLITVSASFDKSNRKYRTIFLVVNGTELKYDLNPSNADAIWNVCRNKIAEIADADPDIPTLISIKDEGMLYRDVVAISDICREIGKEKNVFLKNYLESEND